MKLRDAKPQGRPKKDQSPKKTSSPAKSKTSNSPGKRAPSTPGVRKLPPRTAKSPTRTPKTPVSQSTPKPVGRPRSRSRSRTPTRSNKDETRTPSARVPPSKKKSSLGSKKAVVMVEKLNLGTPKPKSALKKQENTPSTSRGSKRKLSERDNEKRSPSTNSVKKSVKISEDSIRSSARVSTSKEDSKSWWFCNIM